MNNRQSALLNYHRDLAAFSVTKENPVFVILDLDDSLAFKIACTLQPNCADARDSIKDTNALPAMTILISIETANKMLEEEWPNVKRLTTIPRGMVAMMLISSGRCLMGFTKKDITGKLKQ